MKKVLIIFILLLNTIIYSQTELNEADYSINVYAKIGKKVYARELNNQKLPKGNYTIKIIDGRHKISFWFFILDTGEIDGDIELNIGYKKDGVLLEKYQVKNGIVERIQKFDQKREYLEYESFFKGDTLVTRRYKINDLLYYEDKKVNGKETYEYSCSDYVNLDTIEDCTKIDFIKGVEEKYLDGKLIKRIRTKGLSKNIKKIIENYDSKNEITKIIKNTNGVSKTFFRNGNYNIEKPIKGGVYMEEYNKKGVLIESGKIFDMDGF